MKDLKISIDDEIYEIVLKFLNIFPARKIKILEIDDLMTDKLLKEKNKALKALKKGDTISLEQLKKELKL